VIREKVRLRFAEMIYLYIKVVAVVQARKERERCLSPSNMGPLFSFLNSKQRGAELHLLRLFGFQEPPLWRIIIRTTSAPRYQFVDILPSIWIWIFSGGSHRRHG
jgi:hypothetical protein